MSDAPHHPLQGLDRQHMLSYFSHELRNPASVLHSWSDLLCHGHLSTPTEKQEAYQALFSESQRLLHRLADIFLYLRLEDSSPNLQTTRVDLHSLVESIVGHHTPLARTQHLNCVVESSGDIFALEADAYLLNTALSALIQNSMEHSPPNCDVFFRIQKAPSGLLLEVQDQGVGYVPELLEHPLYPLHHKPTMAQNGHLGLGLALAARIIQLHGGTLTLTTLGPGALAKVFLPESRPVSP
jgi:signal transduction histidine kinase